MADFEVPELGENVPGGDVVRIMVKPGDMLKKDQPVLELETDKATIEVPSSVDGIVKELKIKAGDKVKVGQVLLTVDDSAAASAPAKAASRRSDGGQGRGGRAGQGHGRRETGRSRLGEARGTGGRRAASRREDVEIAPSKVVDIGRGQPARPAAAASAVPSGGGLVPAAPVYATHRARAGRRHHAGRRIRARRPDLGRRREGLCARCVDRQRRRGRTPAAGPLPDFSQWGEVKCSRCATSAAVTAERLSAAWTAIRTSRSATRPTSPSSRRCARSTRRRRRKPAASSPSRPLRSRSSPARSRSFRSSTAPSTWRGRRSSSRSTSTSASPSTPTAGSSSR